MAVEFERDGHVALITLNRPEARNAVNGDGDDPHWRHD